MKFKVKAGRKITVRKSAVVAAGDYVGTLASEEQFEGEIVSNESDQIWVKLTTRFPGWFCAIRYKNEDFADILDGEVPPPDPEPEPAPTPSPILVSASITPDGKLQVIVDDPNRLPIHSVWVNNVLYQPPNQPA